MTPGIIYYITGQSHGLLLTVSLHSLRKHYAGPVAILTDTLTGVPASIAADRRLNVSLVQIDLKRERKNSALLAKTYIHRFSPFDPTVFLDADTIPVADPSALFQVPQGKVLFTEFSDWRLATSPYKARCERFAHEAGRMPLFHDCLRRNDPCINTGVFAFWKDAPLLEEIRELAHRGLRVFIPDECAAQLLYPGKAVVVDDRYNLSPRHGKHRALAVCWHCHGSRVLNPATRDLWLTLLGDVWGGNVGNVRTWIGQDRFWADNREILSCIVKS